MNEDRFAFLRPVDAVDHERCGQALQEERRRLVFADPRRQLHEARSGHVALFGIRTGALVKGTADADIRDAIAGLYSGYIRADRDDNTGRFVTENQWKRRRR